MLESLKSKTVIGLILLILVFVGLTLAGKLTPEAVDVLKFLCTTYMSVRVAANIGENLPGNKSKE